MKKLLSVLLSLVSLTVFISAPLSALAADDISGPVILDNPFYAGREIYYGEINSVLENTDAVTLNGKTYYPDGEELYTLLRDKLTARETSFTIGYLSSTRFRNVFALSHTLDTLFACATDDDISETTTDGDYLRWSVSVFGASDFTLDKTKNNEYYYTIKFTTGFYATEAQEKQVDKAVYNFTSSLKTSSLSDYQIIKAVHDYICSKTSYDYDAALYPRKNLTAFSAYGALVGGKCVCQGYAAAFYRICRELGYRVRFVSSNPNEGCHAWNIVELDGKFYFVDCTWDDQILDEGLDFSKYAYFLVSYENVQANDSTYREHLLESKYYDTIYFHDNYGKYFDTKNYNGKDLNQISNCVISLTESKYAFSGKAIKPIVKITNMKGELLKNGIDYTLSYKNNVNTGFGYVIISGKGKYSGDNSVRRFTIIPKKTEQLTVVGTSIAKTSAILSWKKAKGGISGYAVEQWKNDKWVVIKYLPPGTTTLKVTGLASGTKQWFRVRAYKTKSNINFYGAYSKSLSFTTKK